jgi:hypothetical protein
MNVWASAGSSVLPPRATFGIGCDGAPTRASRMSKALIRRSNGKHARGRTSSGISPLLSLAWPSWRGSIFAASMPGWPSCSSRFWSGMFIPSCCSVTTGRGFRESGRGRDDRSPNRLCSTQRLAAKPPSLCGRRPIFLAFDFVETAIVWQNPASDQIIASSVLADNS